MTIESGFFPSVNGDRKYRASFMAKFFASFISNGVHPQPATSCQVIAENGMNVSVRPGAAYINGYIFFNDSNYMLPLAIADGALSRIDRVVLQWSAIRRNIIPVVKTGVISSSPVAPALQRDGDIWELVLADILVSKGTINILQSHITDRRMNDELCGIATGILGHIDATDLFAQYEVAFNNWFDTVKQTLSDDVAGNLQTQIMELDDELDMTNIASGNHLSLRKSGKDDRNIFTILEWRRKDNTLAKRSVLSNPDGDGYYRTQTVTYYSDSGLVVSKVETYTLGYDADYMLISEVLQ